MELPFHVKTSENLKTFKALLKIGMVVHVTVGYVSWTELILSFKFLLLVQQLLILYTTHTILMYIHTQTICF